MTRCKSLRKLRLAFTRRLGRLQRRVEALRTASAPERDLVVSYTAIESLNAWRLFARSFYLSCAQNAITERKRRIAVVPSGLSKNDAVGLAVRCYRPSAQPNSAGLWDRRDEPIWHDPNVMMRVCKNVTCSVQTQIESAFSLGQSVFLHLPVFRNFFAHRNELTCRAAKNIGPRYAIATYLSPAEILLSSRPQASDALIIEWLHEMRITSEFMCR
jgi:hypothetical protein